MKRSDEELIAACRAGDETAWAELTARYQKLIYSIPRRAGFDEEAAADILQQVFVKLLENLEKIQQPAQIQAWLVTTARRETLELIRQRKQKPQIPLDENADEQPAFEPADGAPLADEVLFELDRQHRIRTAVAELDERCRQLITWLFYFDPPPPYAEIAAELKISEGSIGPTRARCLQKLLLRLDDV